MLWVYSRNVGVPTWELLELPAEVVMPDMAIWHARHEGEAAKARLDAMRSKVRRPH